MADQIDGATFVERLKLVGEILSIAEDERARIRREAVDEFLAAISTRLKGVSEREFMEMSVPAYGRLVGSFVDEVYGKMFPDPVMEVKDGENRAK